MADMMADMMSPQTPPRKLFKPSSKTKTPTPVKKQRPITPTASSAQSHDVFTPADTLSRSTDVPSITSRRTSDAAKGSIDSSRESQDTVDQTKKAVRNIFGKPRDALKSSTDDLPEPSNPTDTLNSPTDIAKYFIEQGNQEMSHFVSALTGNTSHDPSSTLGESEFSDKERSRDRGSATNHAASKPTNDTSESIKELPRDDSLIISPNERTKEALDEATSDATPRASDFPTSAGESGQDEIAGSEKTPNTTDSKNLGQGQSFVNSMPDSSKPADVSKEAEGAKSGLKKQALDVEPLNATGKPDTSDISEEAHVAVSKGEDKMNGSAHDVRNGHGQDSDAASNAPSDGTQVADNMGRPAYIQRSIEIPLPRPEKVVSSPPVPSSPDTRNIAAGLGDVGDLPGTEGLPSTDDLPNLPEDMLQDPPEEVLDPSVHSPSSNISPIPKIPKITPIGIAPPPDLLHLAQGLDGKIVDDVGNIVDASGKVLGHATGDLPAMVGRKVAENGEVYGENDEVAGYVSENFVNPPAPADIPGDVLGGLKVDHEGNILDTSGNIIGRFNEKAAENGGLGPFRKRSKTGDTQTKEDPQEEKKPKVNAHTGGSPSDIFLDVKSTTDGIQLTIRIPTTFGRQPQD